MGPILAALPEGTTYRDHLEHLRGALNAKVPTAVAEFLLEVADDVPKIKELLSEADNEVKIKSPGYLFFSDPCDHSRLCVVLNVYNQVQVFQHGSNGWWPIEVADSVQHLSPAIRKLVPLSRW